jgi:tetratricopeptide (TPR) repeat protein
MTNTQMPIAHNFQSGKIDNACVMEKLGMFALRSAGWMTRPVEYVGYSKAAGLVRAFVPSKRKVRTQLFEDTNFEYPYADSYWSRLVYSGDVYSRAEENFLKAIRHIDYAYIDCGANFGYMSAIVTSKAYGKKPAIAIEADPVTFKALEINALNGEVYYHIGNCFVEEQQLDKAIEAYLQACNSNKKNAEFRLTLADTYDANGNSEAAAEYYQQAIELSPEDTLVWIHYIEFLIDEESYEMALELLQEARKHTEDLLLDCVHAAILLESGSRKEGFVILGNILAEDAGMSEQLFEIAPLLEGDEELQQFIKSYR